MRSDRAKQGNAVVLQRHQVFFLTRKGIEQIGKIAYSPKKIISAREFYGLAVSLTTERRYEQSPGLLYLGPWDTSKGEMRPNDHREHHVNFRKTFTVFI